MAKRTPRSPDNDKPQRARSDQPRRRTAAAKTGSIGTAWAAPTEEEIRARAYQKYLERGCGDGMDFDDWISAEYELKHRSRADAA